MNKKTIAGVLGLLVGLLILGWGGCVMIGGITYSEGERTGVVTKFSHKGFPKTWEGELNMGGWDQGGKPQAWAFSCCDPAVVDKLQAAERSGHRVTLVYRQQLRKQPWKGETDYFVTNVVQGEK